MDNQLYDRTARFQMCISAGYEHTVGLKADGTVVTAGVALCLQDVKAITANTNSTFFIFGFSFLFIFIYILEINNFVSKIEYIFLIYR